MRAKRLKAMIMCSMFAALTAAGAFIKIPVPVVPFTLQFMFTTLAGLLLGARLGAMSVMLYIVIGLAGFPVFTAGGGIGYVLQPSFGYLVGFAAGAYITGKIAHAVNEADGLGSMSQAEGSPLTTHRALLTEDTTPSDKAQGTTGHAPHEAQGTSQAEGSPVTTHRTSLTEGTAPANKAQGTTSHAPDRTQGTSQAEGSPVTTHRASLTEGTAPADKTQDTTGHAPHEAQGASRAEGSSVTTHGALLTKDKAQGTTGHAPHEAHRTPLTPSYTRLLIANLAGLLVVYSFGLAYYALISDLWLNDPVGLWPLFLYGFVLAVPGDIAICIASASLAKILIPMLKEITHHEYN